MEESIYFDTHIEDDVIPVKHMPYSKNTARIIDEEEGGVIAYCHVDSAARIVDALSRVRLAEYRSRVLAELRTVADRIESGEVE